MKSAPSRKACLQPSSWLTSLVFLVLLSSSPAWCEEKRASEVRTLETITIEGEIPLPQVLFISSREQPRYPDLLHRRYLKTSIQIGRESQFPVRIRLARAGLASQEEF